MDKMMPGVQRKGGEREGSGESKAKTHRRDYWGFERDEGLGLLPISLHSSIRRNCKGTGN